jgi:hypothetical protein
LTVHVRQTKIHATEPLVPDSSPFEVEIAVLKFKSCKLPVIDQSPAELIQAGDETLHSEINS